MRIHHQLPQIRIGHHTMRNRLGSFSATFDLKHCSNCALNISISYALLEHVNDIKLNSVSYRLTYINVNHFISIFAYK